MTVRCEVTQPATQIPPIDQPKEERDEPECAAVVGGTGRILIVDDEPGQRFIGRISLKRLGYEVAEAEDGHQALEHFEKAKKAREESPYDLIVLDMTMEDGFDGLDTYEAILKLESTEFSASATRSFGGEFGAQL